MVPENDGLTRGRRIGRYVLYEPIASGGMASVHYGRMQGVGGFTRTVAIKRLHPHLARDPEFVSMFLDEARLAARIQHPNVVPTLDIVTAADEVFLVMEYVRGEAFSGLMASARARTTPIPQPIIGSIVIGALHGLHAAHQAKTDRGEPLEIVHRDVSPQNILVGEDGVARIVDFGVAKAAWRAQSTRGDQLKGKIAYMAPEQLRRQRVDRRTDLYAIAVVLWEALASRRLFAGDDPGSIVTQILVDAVPEPSRYAMDVSRELDAFVMRGLARDAGDRFGTAAEMAAELEHVLPLAPQRAVGDWVRACAADILSHRAARLAAVEGASLEKTSLEEVSTGLGTPSMIRRASDAPTTPDCTEVDAGRAPPERGSQVGDLALPRGSESPTRTLVDVAPTESPSGQDGIHLAALASRRRRTRVIYTGIALLSLVGIVGRVAMHRALEPAGPRVPVSLAPQPVPTAVTALPRPRSDKPAAVDAYLEALQGFRDGSTAIERIALQRAIEIDPNLAAAFVRLSLLDSYTHPELAREYYARARETRVFLDERDQGLLDALEPKVARAPSDQAEWERRLGALVVRYPADAELAYWLADARSNRGDLAAADAALQQALRIDPDFANALRFESEVKAYLGDVDGALRSTDRCIELSPASSDCLVLRIELSGVRGECGEVEKYARQLSLVAAGDPEPFQPLASALYGQGAPLATVRESLRRALKVSDEGDRGRLEARDDARLSALAGDFATAQAKARFWLGLIDGEPGRVLHAEATSELVSSLLETGDVAQAGAVAHDYLDRSLAWTPDSKSEDYAIARDPTPMMLNAELRAGLLSRQTFEALRTKWKDGWNAKASAFDATYVWLHGYAPFVASGEEARAALAVLGDAAAPPPYRPNEGGDGQLGWVYTLAGRVDEGVELLTRAARACTSLQFPYELTRAQLLLGKALEMKGDPQGACSAYRVVLNRWGRATPRSVTAGEARARARALGCQDAVEGGGAVAR